MINLVMGWIVMECKLLNLAPSVQVINIVIGLSIRLMTLMGWRI